MVLLSRRSLLLSMTALAAVAALPAQAQTAPPAPALTLKTPAGRAVSVHVWQPAGTPVGRILFSHGAASAPWKYQPLIGAWVKAGYAVYAPLHVDSTDHPDRASFQGMASWPARIEDVRALADHLDGAYIAAGHSYGGLLALCLGGGTVGVPPAVKTPLRDPRAKAVVAFSPPGPGMGFINKGDFAALAVPALIQTGDKDVPPGGNADWHSHLLAFDDAKEGGDRYALVLDGVDHYFGGAICRPELPGPKLDAEIATAAAISVDFMRAYAGADAKALKALKARVTETGPVKLAVK